MSVILIPTDVQTGKTDTGLDQLRRIFNCDSSQSDTRAAMPERYTADSAINYALTYSSDPPVGLQYENMFLTSTQIRETGIKLCEVDMIFEGTLTGDLPDARHDIDQQALTSQATTILGNVSITVLVPVSTLTWFSTIAGEAPGLPAPTIATGFYTMDDVGAKFRTQHITVTNGFAGVVGYGTNFLSIASPGDLMVVYFVYPVGSAKYPSGASGSSVASMASVDSNTHITLTSPWKGPTLTDVKTGSLAPYATLFQGLSGGTLNNLQVVSIRFPQTGFGGLLSGAAAETWGALIIAEYFVSVPVTTIKATELVPGQFWKNVSQTTIQLFPAFSN